MVLKAFEFRKISNKFSFEEVLGESESKKEVGRGSNWIIIRD